MTIRLIVGLGNPGEKYAMTRHNAGFWSVDDIARREKADFYLEHKFQGLVSKIMIAGHVVWLLKPQTYMNLSGGSVGALARFYRLLPEEILVVYDELDLLPGIAKIKYTGSAGGHNGLKDIIAHLGTPAFWRLRLGIGHPGHKSLVSDFVLQAPSRAEAEQIDVAIKRASDVISDVVTGQFERAMSCLHTANHT